MASSSPITGALKQILPYKVKDTEIGRLIASVLPEDLKRGLGNVELGGMSADQKRPVFAMLVLKIQSCVGPRLSLAKSL